MTIEIHEDAVLDLPVTRVWAVVNDPGVLKLCVPGCQEITVVDPTTYRAKAVMKVGFISARFESIQAKKVEATENQNVAYEMAGEDANRIGGFKLGVRVKLGEMAGETSKTRLEIDAAIELKGKFASLGRRLVEWKSKSMMEEFVNNLRRLPA